MKKQILIVGSGFSGMWAAVSAARLSALAGNNSLSIAVLAPVAELRVRPRFYEENVSTMVAPLTELLLSWALPLLRAKHNVLIPRLKPFCIAIQTARLLTSPGNV